MDIEEVQKYLRPYQKSIYDHIIQNNFERECIGAPTGAGKTIVFAAVAKYYQSIGENVIIIVNREELIYQTRQKLHEFGVIPVTLKTNQKSKPIGSVMIAMVETLFRRLKKWNFSEYKYAIIDECHIGIYLKILDYFPICKGFTATPLYIKKGKSLQDFYGSLYYPTQTSELINEGYLAKPKTYVPSNMIKSFKTTMGDYDEKEQSDELVKTKYIDTVVKYWNDRKDKNTLVFNVTISHSLEVEKALKDAGANVVHIDGGTNKEIRNEIRQRLKKETGLWVCNVGVLTFGFDSDNIECIMINRKTKSIPLYNQMCGRGSRSGMYDTFEILDMHGSCIECGTWDEEKNWQYLFTRKKNEKLGVQRIKICPSCEAAIKAAARICEYCGHEYEIKEKEKVFIDDDPNLTEYQRAVKKETTKLINLQKERGYNQYYALRNLLNKEINSANFDSRKPNFDYIVDAFCTEMGWSHGRKTWIKTQYLQDLLSQRKQEDQKLLNSIL